MALYGDALGGALGLRERLPELTSPRAEELARRRVVAHYENALHWCASDEGATKWVKCPCGADVQVGATKHDSWRSCWRCGRRVS